MATKTVPFTVEVKNVVITSGAYLVSGIINPYTGSATQGSFQGNTFSAALREGESEYFAATIFVHSYTLGGVSYNIQDKPITLVATFYLPATDAVKICPESSIASVYTFARMMRIDLMNLENYNSHWLSCTERQAKIAYGMKQHFYRTEGVVADMIKQSPNGFETNSYPMFNSLCNLYYYCLTSPATYNQFLDLAWHKEDMPNTNFLQAVRNMLYDPFYNAGDIYQLLVGKEEVYTDSLTSMKNVDDDKKAPNQWTLTLKSNSSGSKNFIPSGLAYVVFDADDNAWVANNFRAGYNFSGTHCPVYKYDATPASFSPVQGGGLLGVGFGAAIDPGKEYISFGNFGWGPILNNPQAGSISRFYKDGTPVSPSNGYTPGLSRVQGMDYDTSGNLWMASVGSQEPFAPSFDGVYPFESEPSAVVVYINGEPDNMLICDEFPIKKSYDSATMQARTPNLKIFDVAPDNNGNAYVSCIGNYDRENADNCVLSAVYKVAIDNNRLVVTNSWFSDYYSPINKQKGFESLRQVTINAAGDVVVVGVASSRATVLYNDLSGVKEISGVKVYYDVNTYAPWGVKIDKEQTVFLANFGHETDYASNKTLDMQGPFGVTMLRDPSRPDTAQLLTLPTGGSEVMLANGMPLYGTQKKPAAPGTDLEPIRMECYQPIMRLTSTNIDGAGNLWCMNNWKPSAIIDVKDNPGGDGVVIFLGIASPE